MPAGIEPPFEVTLRIDLQGAERPPIAELAQLRRIVLGQEGGFPRASAMALLAETDYPNVHRDLEVVLLNDVEASGVRVAAAMTLWRLQSVQAADCPRAGARGEGRERSGRRLHGARADRPANGAAGDRASAPARKGSSSSTSRLCGDAHRPPLRLARTHRATTEPERAAGCSLGRGACVPRHPSRRSGSRARPAFAGP